MKVRTHTLLDYGMAILLLVAPFVFGLMEIPAARYNFWAVAAITILYTLFTDAKPVIARLMPFTFHRLLDLISGYWLMVVPNIFNYKLELSSTQYWLHIILGLLWIGSAIFTRAPKAMAESEVASTTPNQFPDERSVAAYSKGNSPAWSIATVAASVALAIGVILLGNWAPSVDDPRLSERRANTWQPGPGYVPPTDRLRKQVHPEADPAKAEKVFEVRSDPTIPAFYPERLTVHAGTTNCIRFKNESVHNHHDNLMIVQPGSEREVGIEAVSVGEAGDYIPNLPDKIIAHTETVAPGSSDTVCFKAPEKPGRYPYISTARNRWMGMKGVLVVEPPEKPIS